MLTGRETVEGQQLLARLFQTGGHRRAQLLPLGQEAGTRLLRRSAIRSIDDAVIVLMHRLLGVLGSLGQQVAQLVHAATLMRDAWPDPLQGALQSRIPVTDDQPRPPQVPRRQILQQDLPGRSRLGSRQGQGEQDFLPRRLHPQGHQHRQRDHLTPAAHLRINRVQVKIDDLLLGQVPLPPAIVAFFQPAHQPRHRTFRQRRSAQQRLQRSPDASRVAARQIHAQDRLLHLGRTPSIAGQQPTSPLALLSLGVHQPRPWHLQLHRSRAQRQPAHLLPMPVTATPRRALAPPRSQRLFHFFLQNLFDHLSHPLPNRCFQPFFPRMDLVFHPLSDTLPHGVFLMFLIACDGSSGFFFNGLQENTPFLFLQESGRDLEKNYPTLSDQHDLRLQYQLKWWNVYPVPIRFVAPPIAWLPCRGDETWLPAGLAAVGLDTKSART